VHTENGSADEGRLSRLLSESYVWVDRLKDRPPGSHGSWPQEVVDTYSNDLEDIRARAEELARPGSADFNELLGRLDGFCQVMREAYATYGSVEDRLAWLRSDESFAWEERIKLDAPYSWSAALVEDVIANLRSIRADAEAITDPRSPEAQAILERLDAFWRTVHEGYAE
jgi:hypothetical protein